MNTFLHAWSNASLTSIGFFWMAFWAFALGYLVSSLIQELVTRKRMKDTMGESGFRSVAIGSFFGFISSSCSFAALSTTRALFKKGAGLVPSLAFMLASTNLVIELGIVIGLFLSWQFVVGEYIGGIFLIGFAWLFVSLTAPTKLIKEARNHGSAENGSDSDDGSDWKHKVMSLEGWQQIGMKYVMEWQMVWKDVLIGFTVAGIISAFVPDAFFEALFMGSGGQSAQNPGFANVLMQAFIGPIAAFFTFIGSMGNIPLAALLYDHGVSFAGVMAFIFSDLVVLPVLRINAGYYGWKMAFYILGLLLTGLVSISVLMHYGFLAFDLLPHGPSEKSITQNDAFSLDYGFVLNLIFLIISAALYWLSKSRHSRMDHDHQDSDDETSLSHRIETSITWLAALWLAGGTITAMIFA